MFYLILVYVAFGRQIEKDPSLQYNNSSQKLILIRGKSYVTVELIKNQSLNAIQGGIV